MKKWFVRFALLALLGMVLFVGFAFLRLKFAQNLSETAPLQLGETKKLEILPLYEKESLNGFESGHGVSYLIRTDNVTILFDLGNSPAMSSPAPVAQNMTRLGISLEELDLIVISHRHPDHVGGQNWWTKNTFSLDGLPQPALGALPIYIPEALTYPGSSPILSTKPVRLAEGVATTGLITYAQPFPIWLAMPKGDEQALAINVQGQGIILITGCGHMGLEALLGRAKAIFDAPVVGIVGGLHYGNTDPAALQPEIQLVRELDPVLVALSPHDSEAAARNAFAQTFSTVYQPIQVGKIISFP